ncbi:hypothetical protein PFISCL1PPCAC_3433, partial [Pristionchus fissidentatus]
EINVFLVCFIIFLTAMVAVLLYVLVLLYRYAHSESEMTVTTQLHDIDLHDVYVCPKKEAMATVARVCNNHDSTVPPKIVMVPDTPPPDYRSLDLRPAGSGSPLPSYEELMINSARSTVTFMTVEDVEMRDVQGEESAAPPEPFPTISILQLVKEAQQQHGLRHGDYNRYRVYCADKLRRVRSALKVTNAHKCMKRHKAKFAKKAVAVEAFSDMRYVQLPLFEVERRWAQAMNCKTALEDNPTSRQRHAMRNSLKKAVQHVATLESLVKASPRCDAPTKLECQAYSLWLKGIVAFELREWSSASESLKAARVIYEKLAAATPNSVLANLYTAKCREIQPQLRLCEFNSTEAPKASMSELMKLKEEMGTESDSIDHLIAEMRLQAKTDDSIPIEWAGVIAPAGDEK